MFLQHLSVVNYKNIAEAELDFCRGVNCFVGHNGAGKTNVCDAVYYLAFCKSRQFPFEILDLFQDGRAACMHRIQAVEVALDHHLYNRIHINRCL